MSEFVGLGVAIGMAAGVVVSVVLMIDFAGVLFEFGRGVLRPWSMVRMARAELHVKRLQLEAEQINAELRRLAP